jgi:hypothetical protein
MGDIVPSIAFGHGMPCPYCRGLNGVYPAQSWADPQRLKPQRKELVTARLKSCPDVRKFLGIARAGGWPSQAALK